MKRLLYSSIMTTAMFLVVCSMVCWALDPVKSISQYNFDIWNTERGLPQNSVIEVIQTRDGYIWVATEEGLARFDGIRFTVYDKKTTPAITDNYINDLYQTRSGVLWLGTKDGLIKMEQGIFSQVQVPHALDDAEINCFFEDSQGTLWIGTSNRGLLVLADNVFTNISLTDPETDYSKAYSVQAINEDNQGQIWIGTARMGMGPIVHGTYQAIPNQHGTTDYSVRSLFFDQTDTLWIGTAGAGLGRYHSGTWQFYTQNDGILDKVVTSIIQDREGNLWVGTFRGLNRLIGDKIESFSKKQGFPYDLVLSMCEDHEGNLWIGTSGGGLCRLKDGKFTTYTEMSGLSNNDVFSICEDGKGLIWIGTSGGGLNCLSQEGIEVYTTEDGLNDNRVFSVYSDRDDVIWIGTSSGFSILRALTISRLNQPAYLTDVPVMVIYQDRNGTMWFGTEGQGLISYKDGHYLNHHNTDGVLSTIITSVVEDKDGVIWVGTDGNGLDRFSQGVWQNYSVEDGLAGQIIMSLYIDNLNVLWIGTFGDGLCLYKDGIFKTMTTRDGLFDDVIFQILEDDQGSLWISCNKGIYSIPKQDLLDYFPEHSPTLAPVTYGTMDGMKSCECNGGVQPAGWKSRDGRLWFPTLKGVAMIDPAHIRRNPEPPLVIIETVYADDIVFSSPKNFSLPPGTEKFEFHYAGLSFYAPEQVTYRYMLEGFDRNWVEAGVRRDAYYTNIPPGHYRFAVTARNSDGVWNETGASVQFYLAPYFYQTYTFYFLCLCLLLAGTFLAYRRHISTIQKRQIELERLVSEQTKKLNDRAQELKEKSDLLEKLSRSDALTGIANRRRFEERYDEEWRRSVRLKTPLSVIMIDIDFFKLYNDTYGHQSGDECLKQVTHCIATEINRPGDLVARYGGEEFVIILFNTDLSGATNLAQKLRAKVERLHIPNENSSIHDYVTISLGVAALIPLIALPTSVLIEQADNALYLAKNQGRNRVIALKQAKP
ncbi:diguanylate cyclase [bacterium]|nr:diguanylate cyclase [bacterium]